MPDFGAPGRLRIRRGSIAFVEDEARCHGATIVLLRVVAPFRSSLMMVPSLVEQATKQILMITQDDLDRIASSLPSEGFEVEVKIEHGPPA